MQKLCCALLFGFSFSCVLMAEPLELSDTDVLPSENSEQRQDKGHQLINESSEHVSTVQLETPVDRLSAKIAHLRTYQASFEQRVHNELGEEIDLTSGRFLIEKPNHFRWQIEQQYEQLIVADGAHVFTYDPDLEQVTIQNQSKLLADSPLLFLTSDSETLSNAFEIAIIPVVDNENRLLFHLKPKDQQGVFESVHILFEGEQMIELLMKDSLGQQTSVRFTQIQINQKLDASLFSFNMPEGVDIVDSREQIGN